MAKDSDFFTLWLLMWLSRLLPRRRIPISAIDVAEIKKRMAGEGLKPSELVESQVRDSTIAWSWVNGSLLDRNTRSFPSTLSKKMREWLVGLGYGQLVMLKNAGAKGIFEHVDNRNMIGGVPPMQPLPPAVVRYPPPPKSDPKEPRVIRQG
jgi:hypothetical protein